MNRLFKRISLLVIFLSVGFMMYFSPYIAIHNLYASVESQDVKSLSKFINYSTIEKNIFERYKKNMFGDVKDEDISQDKVNKLKIIEESLKYGIDILIEPENLEVLLNALRLEKTPADIKFNVVYRYIDMNTFEASFVLDGKPQQIIFKRNSLILWKIEDIIFPVDFNLFS